MKLFRVLSIIFLITFITIGCGSSGGGDDNGSNSSDNSNGDNNGGGDTSTKTIISGKANLPWESSSGRLFVLVDGMDGNIYAEGSTDNEGNFNIEIEVPADLKRVLLYAINPDNPADYVMAYAELDRVNSINISQASTVQNLFPVNIESTAEVYVSMATGLLPVEFTSEELLAVNEMLNDFKLDPPNLCSVDKTPTLIDPDRKRNITVDDYVDAFVNAEGALILRVKQAQKDVSENVTSANAWDGWRTDRGTILGSLLGVTLTRIALSATLGPEVELRGGLTKESISLEELELAADIINDTGYGNCREKGMFAAYIASRFEEFQQVAFVGAQSELYGDPHGFAIACREPDSVWDIKDLIHMYDETIPIPDGLYSSGCVFIDPWGKASKELTRDSVKSLKWQFIEHVMKVDLKGNTTDTGTGGATSSPDLDLYTDLCTPFGVTCSIDAVTNLNQAVDGQNDSSVCSITEIQPSEKYYVFKRSGTGYRKMWGGWATKMTGHDYNYRYIYPSDVTGWKDYLGNFDQFTTWGCDGGSALCPCAPWPDIWVSGSLEVVAVVDTYEEMEQYRCDTPHYGGDYVLCNDWESESSQDFWETINGICGT